MCREAAKLMKEQQCGRIVNISSRGWLGNFGQTNYAASKGGMISLTRVLALELGKYNVLVNVVAPGLIETDMTRALPDEVRQQWVTSVPLGRLGTATEVAAAVCFLASDEAAYITGQVLAVNGGMYM